MKKILYSILTLVFILTLFAFSSSSSLSASEHKNLIGEEHVTFYETHVVGGSGIALQQGEDYTIQIPESMLTEGGTPQISIYLLNEEHVDMDYDSSNTRYTHTFTAPHEMFQFEITNLRNGEQYGAFIGMDGFQLEKGSQATAYEPYQSDTTPPEFDNDGIFFSDVDNPATTDDIKNELTAYDETDGDVSNSISLVEDNYSGNEGSTGDYDTVWQAEDSSGNLATTTVIVRVVDITAPEIDLNGSDTIYLEVHDSWSDPGASVTDNYDSNINYTTSGSVDTSSLGTYTIEYDSVDSSGNEADTVTRTIIVQDTTAPVIDLNGSDTIYIEYGDNYNELGAVVTDNYDDNLEVNISGSVDVGTLGEYTITYNAVDSSGNEADTVTRTVIVENTTPPTLDVEDMETFNASEVDLDHLISHFTANDSHDGDLTDLIEIIDDNYTGNETTTGEYEVTLRVTNAEGTSTTETITITVLDNTPPVITYSDYILDEDEANAMSQQEIRDHILGN